MSQQIKDLQKRLKDVCRQADRLRGQEDDIRSKIWELQEQEERAKASKKFHVGDCFFSNSGVSNYHCTVFHLYEVLEVKLGRWPTIKVRDYSLGYSDGDYYAHIEKSELQDYAHVGKRISKKQFEELKEIIYNPETYETSKWNAKEK